MCIWPETFPNLDISPMVQSVIEIMEWFRILCLSHGPEWLLDTSKALVHSFQKQKPLRKMSKVSCRMRGSGNQSCLQPGMPTI